jgi:hypothetical protein
MMVTVEQLVEWRLAGETEVLGENLPQSHFVHHKSHMTRPGLEPGPPPAATCLVYSSELKTEAADPPECNDFLPDCTVLHRKWYHSSQSPIWESQIHYVRRFFMYNSHPS